MRAKKKKQITIGLVTSVILFSIATPSMTTLASASQLKQATVTMNNMSLPTPTGEEVLASTLKVSDIILIEGVAYDLKGNIVVDNYGESYERGRLSWAVKAIRKGYSKLPSGVKKTINRFTSLEVILGTLDHWTGAVEDGIVWACKKAGMPDGVAWFVAKALTAIAL